MQVNTGAVTTGHGKAHATAGLELFEFGMQSAAIVTPVAVAEPLDTGDAPGNSAGHGNSQHADKSASAKAADGQRADRTGRHTRPRQLAARSQLGVRKGIERPMS